jgi:hypothetical protein
MNETMHSSLEPLESRIAPAALLPGGKVVKFTDFDGDLVTVKVSKPVFTDANVAGIFSFAGSAFGDSGPQRLSVLNLFNLGTVANGLDVTVSAKAKPGTAGNGLIHFSGLNASNLDFATGTGAGIDLGKVRIQGNIDFIDAGDANPATPALKRADLLSLGATNDGVQSAIYGKAGRIVVHGSLHGNLVVNAVAGSQALAGLKALMVTGSVGPGFDGNFAGRIEVGGDLGTLQIGGDLAGGVAGQSGFLTVGGSAGSITIGGSIIGGDVLFTGAIDVTGRIDSLRVGGSLVGYDGPGSAYVEAGSYGDIFIGGDIRGYRETGLNTQAGTGVVFTHSSIDRIVVAGSVFAGSIVAGISAGGDGYYGTADDSDLNPAVTARIAKVIVRGTVTGTSNAGDSFGILANQFGSVKIGPVLYLPTDPHLSFATGIELAVTGDFKLRTL